MKILLIGGKGSIGNKHLENLRVLGYEDVYICDPNGGDYESIYQVMEKYDLYIIATPSETHLEYIHFLNNRGAKYIFCEKPIHQGKTTFQIMAEMGLPPEFHELKAEVFINNAYRFERGINKLKELVEQGVAGKIGGVFMENWYSFSKMHPTYNLDKLDPHFVLYDDCHIINTSRYLWGEPDKITYKKIGKLRADFGWITDKGIEVVHTTLETSSRYKKRIEVVGDKGNLIYNFKAHEIFFAPADESERIAIPYKHADHLAESLKYALGIVESGGKFEQNTIDDAIKDLEIIQELCG